MGQKVQNIMGFLVHDGLLKVYVNLSSLSNYYWYDLITIKKSHDKTGKPDIPTAEQYTDRNLGRHK